jgi:hypothetical protein
MLAAIPVRVTELVVKMISTKGLVFAVATAAWWYERVDFWQWLACAGLVVGVRTVEKIKGGGATPVIADVGGGG